MTGVMAMNIAVWPIISDLYSTSWMIKAFRNTCTVTAPECLLTKSDDQTF